MTQTRSLQMLDWSLHAGGSLLALALALGGWYGVDQLVNSRIQHLNRRTANAAGFLNTKPKIEAENSKLQHDVAENSARFSELLARIPSEVRESDFLAQVSELARRCELQIRDYRPGSVANRTRHHELDIAVSAEGTYAAFCRFLDGVHTLPRLSRVTSLQIVAPPAPDSNIYPVDMTLRIYFSQLHTAD